MNLRKKPESSGESFSKFAIDARASWVYYVGKSFREAEVCTWCLPSASRANARG